MKTQECFFYFKRKAYPAAIVRLQKAMAKAGDSPIMEKTLYYLGKSFSKNGDTKRAGHAFEDLRTRYPRSTYLD